MRTSQWAAARLHHHRQSPAVLLVAFLVAAGTLTAWSGALTVTVVGVLVVAVGIALAVVALRRASAKVDTILADELDHGDDDEAGPTGLPTERTRRSA